MSKFVLAFKQTKNFFLMSIPVIGAVLLLVALVDQLVGFSQVQKIFVFSNFINVVLGASVGSLIAGNPIVSYVLGGEFLKHGIELGVVLAFLLAWVTVGLVQLPAESILLGKKFALIRNLMSFLSAILISFLIILIL